MAKSVILLRFCVYIVRINLEVTKSHNKIFDQFKVMFEFNYDYFYKI